MRSYKIVERAASRAFGTCGFLPLALSAGHAAAGHATAGHARTAGLAAAGYATTAGLAKARRATTRPATTGHPAATWHAAAGRSNRTRREQGMQQQGTQQPGTQRQGREFRCTAFPGLAAMGRRATPTAKATPPTATPRGGGAFGPVLGQRPWQPVRMGAGWLQPGLDARGAGGAKPVAASDAPAAVRARCRQVAAACGSAVR